MGATHEWTELSATQQKDRMIDILLGKPHYTYTPLSRGIIVLPVWSIGGVGGGGRRYVRTSIVIDALGN